MDCRVYHPILYTLITGCDHPVQRYYWPYIEMTCVLRYARPYKLHLSLTSTAVHFLNHFPDENLQIWSIFRIYHGCHRWFDCGFVHNFAPTTTDLLRHCISDKCF